MANNPIPGSGVVGFGFNVLGPYNYNSVVKQILTHKILDEQTFTHGGVTYNVPDNVTPLAVNSNEGKAYTFAGKQEVQKHFASDLHASLGVNVGLSTLSGEFDEAYSSDQNTIQSHTYGIYEENFNAFDLVLESTDQSWFHHDFLTQMKALPKKLTMANRQLFFQFFGEWGTHYVHKVTLGGRLYYYVTVDDSFSSVSTDTKRQIELEYKAAFTDTKADSANDWKKMDQNWASSRSVSYVTYGGDTALSGSVESGENFNDAYTKWNAAVVAAPASIDFQLAPISALFLGAQQDAVAQALRAYTNASVVITCKVKIISGGLSARPTALSFADVESQILLEGVDITPPTSPAPPYSNGNPAVGFNLAILDGATLTPVLNKMYYLPVWPDPSDPVSTIYDAMFADVKRAITTRVGYVVILAGAAVPDYVPPSGRFAGWLQDCGATWTSWTEWAEADLGTVGNYVCVAQEGLFAEGAKASEYFEEVGHQVPGPPLTTAIFVVLYPPVDAGMPYSVVSPYSSQ